MDCMDMSMISQLTMTVLMLLIFRSVFWFMNQVFLTLLSFSKTLTTKYVLNEESCITRPTFIDLNPVVHNYYPFMISLDKCSESCDAVDDLFTNICARNKTKCVNAKVPYIITRIYEAKTLLKHIFCDYKCKFNSITCNSSKKRNDDTCHCKCKNYRICKNDYNWNSCTYICENSKHLKRIVDDSGILCDEITNVRKFFKYITIIRQFNQIKNIRN